ncbi:39S ribosomal protein L38, mitochondrial isoform X3 [Salmo salar]|uniref:39S ribosomal protein L38, mitochondrial isoform X3 n=1 Tax=Salmo salar TaxID=8030 RepID=A0ABM3E5V1_SALSA|nr:39S ribosomal protein L38, mitochondrial isoform X3 [Salmo salar]
MLQFCVSSFTKVRQRPVEVEVLCDSLGASTVVNVPLDRVQAGWEETSGPYHVQRLADHYGIFKDQFPMAYFVPWVTLSFSYDQDSSAQVHYGNHLMPKEMSICWIVKGSVCAGWLGTSQVGL